MKIPEIRAVAPIMEKVSVVVKDNTAITVKGPKGEISRVFRQKSITITVQNNEVVLSVNNANKRDKTLIYTLVAHIKNMIHGVVEPYVYKLKICSGHFPMTVTTKGKEFSVKNFLGEKTARVFMLKDGVDVKIDADIVTVTSPDIEKAGQTAGELEKLTRITNRDRRVFQDGIWMISKAGVEL